MSRSGIGEFTNVVVHVVRNSGVLPASAIHKKSSAHNGKRDRYSAALFLARFKNLYR
jgi:hypothetical protein